jgi:hypothetical protein
MPYIVQPLVDRRVVMISVSGSLSLPEIRARGQEVNALLSEGESPVHIVIDTTRLVDYPLSPSKIFEASPFLSNANLGEVPVYGVTSLLLTTFLNVFGLMTTFHYHLVQSLPEALDFLRARDSRIDTDAVTEALRRASELLNS